MSSLVLQYLMENYPKAGTKMLREADALGDDVIASVDTRVKSVGAKTLEEVASAPKQGKLVKSPATKATTPRASPKSLSAAKRKRSPSKDAEDETPRRFSLPPPASKGADAAVEEGTTPSRPSQGFSGARSSARLSASDPSRRFQRIDPSKVQFINEALKDNRAGNEATSFRQNQLMLAVRGKEFNKHKQKNKAKLYAAGVDQTIRSFKFDE